MFAHSSVLIALIFVTYSINNPVLTFRHNIHTTKARLSSKDKIRLHQAAPQNGGSPVGTIVKNEEVIREEMRLDREKSDTEFSISEVDMVNSEVGVLDSSFLQSLKKKRSYISIVTERLMQSIDDAELSRRIKKSTDKAMLNSPSFYTQKAFSRLRSESKREKLVVLGTGWGGHALLKTIDATKYDVTVISPRNFFMFTPMLSASAVGTVEFRSICEPIRNVNPFVEYLEASATEVDVKNQKVTCLSIKCEGTACDFTDFDIEYDHLLIAVGATSNTFNIKGVREHCQFLKQVEDAAKIRRSIAYCFERANIPGLSEEEMRSALSFVIVGAGPTGVEFTGELRDWLENEGRKYYGRLLKYVKITVVEAGAAVLPVFDKALQDEALKRITERETALVRDGYIEKEMTTVLLRAGVKEIDDKKILLSTGESLTYGFCVWAAGNGPIPFVLDFIESVEEQKNAQSKARGRIVTDSWLRVLGAENVYSIGDCAMMEESPLPATAQVASQQGAYLGRLFSKGFTMKTPVIKAPPLSSSSTKDSSTSSSSSDVAAVAGTAVAPSVVQLPPYKIRAATAEDAGVVETSFASERLGLGRLSVPVEIKAKEGITDDSSSNSVAIDYAKPFQFLNLGVLAYIGAAQALAQISVDDKNILGSGPVGFLLWRSIYWSKQVSWRNRALVSVDWLKGRLFGRDIGAV